VKLLSTTLILLNLGLICRDIFCFLIVNTSGFSPSVVYFILLLFELTIFVFGGLFDFVWVVLGHFFLVAL